MPYTPFGSGSPTRGEPPPQLLPPTTISLVKTTPSPPSPSPSRPTISTPPSPARGGHTNSNKVGVVVDTAAAVALVAKYFRSPRSATCSPDHDGDDDIDGNHGDHDGCAKGHRLDSDGRPPHSNSKQQQQQPDSSSSNGSNSNNSNSDDKNVALYDMGATELFMAIAEVDWERAVRIVAEHPDQASVWVVSTGTVHTTFDWSVWRRLPLHEAARRQAPVALVARLIAAYPAAVGAATHFGELPLHLAVGCGAAPDVVCLLVSHHWRGCQASDRSGRTPLDVLRQSVDAQPLLDPVAHRDVATALEAAHAAHREIAAEHASELAAMQAAHAAGLAAVQSQHDADWQLEKEQQERLLAQIAALRLQMQQQAVALAGQDAEHQRLRATAAALQDAVAVLEAESVQWQRSFQRERQRTKELRQTVRRGDARAATLSERVTDLQTAIQRLAAWHQTTVRTTIERVNRKFHAAMRDLAGFTSTLSDHDEDLQALLVEMGVAGGGGGDGTNDDTPKRRGRTSHRRGGDDDDKENDDTDDDDKDDYDDENPMMPPEQIESAPPHDEEDDGAEGEDDVLDAEAMLRAALAASQVLGEDEA